MEGMKNCHDSLETMGLARNSLQRANLTMHDILKCLQVSSSNLNHNKRMSSILL